MKAIVNYPDLEDDKKELKNRVAIFHATLLIEKIKQLNINDISKQKLLNLVLDKLKEECMKN